MKQLIELTPEKFAEIYTSEKFRNEVAFAHGCKYEGQPEYKKTCSYPVEYIVTDMQVAEATKERERAKIQTVKDNEGKLMFVGMGMEYSPRYADDVCNHRIRTEFVNAEGHRFFIELGTGRGDQMRIDHSIDRDLEDLHDTKLQELRAQLSNKGRFGAENTPIYNEMKKWENQSYNNFAKLEHKSDLPKYTLQNVLKLVNKYFNCNFSEIVIDNYNVSCGDYVSISPKALQTA